jgi:hypothetical protein
MNAARICADPKCGKEFFPITPRQIGRQKYCSQRCVGNHHKRKKYIPVVFDRRLTDEVRQKISASLKGRKVPEAVVAKRAKAQTGRKLSFEARMAIKQRMKGKGFPRDAIKKSADKRRGVPLSDEHKAALVAGSKHYPNAILQAIGVLNKLRKVIHEKQD